MKSSAITVTTSPTLLVAADDIPRTIYIHVVGNSTVYLGDSTVTTTNGLATEKHTAPLTFFVPQNQTIYGIVAADTANVRILTPDVD